MSSGRFGGAASSPYMTGPATSAVTAAGRQRSRGPSGVGAATWGNKGGLPPAAPAAATLGNSYQQRVNAGYGGGGGGGALAASVQTLEEVMDMNTRAMELLRAGDSGQSRMILSDALSAVENSLKTLQEEIARVQVQGPGAAAAVGQRGRNSRPPPQRRGGAGGKKGRSRSSQRAPAPRDPLADLRETHDSWLLSYATTLSNLGCLLRREGDNDGALMCLSDARDVESSVGAGKPSCSTMMNLSAVLLSVGDFEAALPIAKDCVTAAQSGDRVLFITALHNLAVTLGQQQSDRERSAALPTMLRALREAQEHLGENHPTTLMIKDKCDTTHQWVFSQKERKPGPPIRSVAAPPPPQQLQQQQTGRAPFTETALTSKSSTARSLEGNTWAATGGSQMGHSGKKPPVNLAPLAGSEVAAPRPSSDGHEAAARGSRGDGARKESRLSTTSPAPAGTAAAVMPRTSVPSARSAGGAPAEAVRETLSAREDVQRASPKAPAGAPQLQAHEPVGKTSPTDTAPAEVSGGAPLQAQEEEEGVRSAAPPHGATAAPAPGPITAAEEQAAAVTHPVPRSDGAAHPLANNPPPTAPALRQTETAQAAVSEAAPQPRQLRATEEKDSAALAASESGHLVGSATQATPALADRASMELFYSPSCASSKLSEREAHMTETLEGQLTHGTVPRQPKGADAALVATEEGAATAGTTAPAPEGAPAANTSKGHRVNIYAGGAASFLRFADLQTARDVARSPPTGASESVILTYQKIRRTLRAMNPDLATAATHPAPGKSARGRTPDGKAATPGPDGADESAETGTALRSALQTYRERSTASRLTRRAEEELEEAAYRRRKARADALAAEEAAFQAALQEIIDRTRGRAATTIQSLWRTWWQNVGQARREAQLRRAAERERRLRERLLAIATDATRGKDVDELVRQHKDTVGAARNEHAAGRLAPPGAVVRCGQKWLQKTEAVRWMARKRVLQVRAWARHADDDDDDSREERAGESGAAYSEAGASSHQSSRPRWNETSLQATIVLMQKMWRGALARMHFAKRKELEQAMASPGSVAGPDGFSDEDRAYAAIVIQCAYRRHAAAGAYQRRYVEFYTPIALLLQRWYRATITEQRSRGVDGATVRRRHRAALMIQCAWRCFTARLQAHMRRLKRTMHALRVEDRERCAEIEDRKRATAAAADAAAVDAAKASAEAGEGAQEQPQEQEEEEVGFRSVFTGKVYPPIDITRTEYEEECAARANGVYRTQEANYENFDVPLHWEPVTERYREEVARDIAMRPFLVQRRRAGEDLRTVEELYALRRPRAAVKIQRAFREWLRHRYNPNRDCGLLLMSQGRYQQHELVQQTARAEHRRLQDRGVRIYGDHAKTMREAVQEVRQELAEMQDEPGTQLVCLSPAPIPPHLPLRSPLERRDDELTLQADEKHVAETYPRDVAKLRGDVYYTGYNTGTKL